MVHKIIQICPPMQIKKQLQLNLSENTLKIGRKWVLRKQQGETQSREQITWHLSRLSSKWFKQIQVKLQSLVKKVNINGSYGQGQ